MTIAYYRADWWIWLLKVLVLMGIIGVGVLSGGGGGARVLWRGGDAGGGLD